MTQWKSRAIKAGATVAGLVAMAFVGWVKDAHVPMIEWAYHKTHTAPAQYSEYGRFVADVMEKSKPEVDHGHPNTINYPEAGITILVPEPDAKEQFVTVLNTDTGRPDPDVTSGDRTLLLPEALKVQKESNLQRLRRKINKFSSHGSEAKAKVEAKAEHKTVYVEPAATTANAKQAQPEEIPAGRPVEP